MGEMIRNPECADDLSALEYLDQNVLCNLLQTRFESGKYYTYTGDVLIAVNPCRELAIYDDEHHKRYTRLLERKRQPPHIFWVADEAYRSMVECLSLKQCIVVSGDSGSGKTESTKYILKHLARQGRCSKSDLVKHLDAVNPLIELFGNASTSLNSNSSRFGKLIELLYDNVGDILGANIQYFVLEKSRVVEQSLQEKNFHIFYSVFAGMDTARLQEFNLQDSSDYRIIRGHSSLSTNNRGRSFQDPSLVRDYAKMFKQAENSLDSIGFSEDEKSQIYHVIAAILHISNIEFDEDESDGVVIVDEEPLTEVCNQLILPEINQLAEALIATTTFVAGKEVKYTHKSISRANDGRDAVAKELYSCVFHAVVQRINRQLSDLSYLGKRTGESPSIGILDIFGFEDLNDNRFEQLLINLANEKLHHYFQEHVFQLEKQDFEDEGIRGDQIKFHDNSDVLYLFEKIVDLLEDEIRVPGSNNMSLVKTLNNKCSSHAPYRCENGCNIGIVHYARKVTYCVEGFLEKNTDTLSNSLRECLQKSGNTFVEYFFSWNNQIQETGFNATGLNRKRVSQMSVSRAAARKINFQSEAREQKQVGVSGRPGKMRGFVTQSFKKSLERLTSKLKEANPFFVRCIKPNEKLLPDKFDKKLTRQQLESSGLLEVAHIRHSGFPVRLKFESFSHRYKTLVDFFCGILEEDIELLDSSSYSKHSTIKVLSGVNIEGYQIGLTKVFLKYDHLEQLSKFLEKLRIEKEAEKRQIAHEQHLLQSEACRSPSSKLTDNGINNENTCVTNEQNIFEEGVSTEFSKGMGQFFVNIPTEPDMEKPVRPSETNTKRLAFDMFRLTERDFEDSRKCEELFMRIMRVVMYIVLFLVVLVTAIGSSFTLLLMASDLHQDSSRTSVVSNNILICIAAPMALTWFVDVLKVMFGTKRFPSVRFMLAVIALEGIQMFGVALFLLIVVHRIGLVHSVIIILASCNIPSLLNFFGQIQGHRKSSTNIKTVVCIIASVFALVIQWGVHPVIHTTNIFEIAPQPATASSKIFPEESWIISLSLILMSVGNWENFIHKDIKIERFTIPFAGWRRTMMECREAISVFVRPASICFFIIFTHVMVDRHDFTLETVSNSSTQETSLNSSTTGNYSTSNRVSVQEVFQNYGYILLQVVSTIICSYAASLACKLQMQRFAFSLALILTTPVTVTLLILQCTLDTEGYIWFTDRLVCATQTNRELMFVYLAGICLWISTILLTFNVWRPSCERMAKEEKLFVTPIRDAVCIGLNLLLRRRQDLIEQATESYSKTKKHDTINDGDNTDNQQDEIRPFLYVCATMWHEVRVEMIQLLKSLFRMDLRQIETKLIEKKFKIRDPDYFDLSIHIIFDDAFETDQHTKQRVANSWVRQLVECVDEAAMSVAKGHIDWKSAPSKVTTPYGGQLVWTMPGGTIMTVHMKDKNKIRHRKRWSQILYLYYLLGFKAFGMQTEETVMDKSIGKKKRNRMNVRPVTSLLNKLDPKTVKKNENTFIMALDGDVDFRPDAVQLLLDRMKKNKKVGAVCGRIHPIGTGPMVWYQQFEYAVGHWLQKATEHVYGCVLCCPGCFSVFRASALMDDNVMRMYTTKPTEARHFIQYEQGEDRWLCTLLLQQGYKIDYCAGADALTYAPETFRDFYIQRRRWAPSTLANIMDLLSSWRITVKMNDNISTLFILYQFILLASSMLSPGAIILMIAGSFNAVLKISIWWSYTLTMAPVVIFIIVCLKTKNDTQILVAGFLSTIFTVVMVIVTIATIMNIISDNPYAPNVLFFEGLAVVFVIAGICHPTEFFCLVYGILYFLTVPSTFVFLTIYYFCNLHIVTWGTREGPIKADQNSKIAKEQKMERKGILNALGVYSLISDLCTFIRETIGGMHRAVTQTKENENRETEKIPPAEIKISLEKEESNPSHTIMEDPTFWTLDTTLGKGPVDDLKSDETTFWHDLLRKYLQPIAENKEEQEKIKADLESIRNNCVFGVSLLNLLFSIGILQLQTNKEDLKDFFIFGQHEPISIAFMAAFGLILTLQFLAMFAHRWGTFLHLIASTHVGFFRKGIDKLSIAREETQILAGIDLPPDYDTDSDADEETGRNATPKHGEPNSLQKYDIPPDYSASDEEETVESNKSKGVYERQFNMHFKTKRHRYKQRRRRMPDDFFRKKLGRLASNKETTRESLYANPNVMSYSKIQHV